MLPSSLFFPPLSCMYFRFAELFRVTRITFSLTLFAWTCLAKVLKIALQRIQNSTSPTQNNDQVAEISREMSKFVLHVPKLTLQVAGLNKGLLKIFGIP